MGPRLDETGVCDRSGSVTASGASATKETGRAPLAGRALDRS
jgi:hypothetical protein